MHTYCLIVHDLIVDIIPQKKKRVFDYFQINQIPSYFSSLNMLFHLEAVACSTTESKMGYGSERETKKLSQPHHTFRSDHLEEIL